MLKHIKLTSDKYIFLVSMCSSFTYIKPDF